MPPANLSREFSATEVRLAGAAAAVLRMLCAVVLFGAICSSLAN